MTSNVCSELINSLALPAVVASVFLFFTPFVIISTRRKQVVVKAGWLGVVKIFACLVLFATILSRLIIHLRTAPKDTQWIVLTSISLAASSAVTWLSPSQHRVSIRPSTILVIYLLASIGCDILKYLEHGLASDFTLVVSPEGGLEAAGFCVKIVLISLESLPKPALWPTEKRDLAPEELSSVLGNAFFWWINPILALGNKSILDDSDLPNLESKLGPEISRARMIRCWNDRVHPGSLWVLPRSLFKTLKAPFLSPIVPGILVVVFRGSQPLLIREVIRFVSRPRTKGDDACGTYLILVSSFCVYIGLTLSTCQYEHRANKLRVMVKESLIGLVYNKTLLISSRAGDAGKAITIMSTDVDGVASAVDMFHNGWGHLLELVIGMLILANFVKWLWPVPLVLIFACSRVSRYVALNIRSRQKNWNQATQSRITALGSVLGHMKSLKALGISESIAKYVHSLREKEMESASQVRWIQVVYNASANALGILTPAITVVLFAILANVSNTEFEVDTAFATVAVLTIVTHPANMIMTIIPRVIASMASFERLQSFLALPDVEIAPIETVLLPSNDFHDAPRGSLLSLKQVDVSVHNRPRPILHNIDLRLDPGTVTICCGPVGSGKSVLARTLLGEWVPSSGGITKLSSLIGYCDQSSWIPSGTLKDIICAFSSNVDLERYNEAVRASCLDHDITRLPAKDMTIIGSRGVNLSGGQRQRVALARLLYAKCAVAVLDDPFAALDGKTEEMAVANILGANGLLRKAGTTVFWVTNSAQYFSIADNIVVLKDSQICAQGPWNTLSLEVKDMRKFVSSEETTNITSANDLNLVMRRAKSQAEKDAEDDLYRQTGDSSLYGYYIRAAGYTSSLCLVVCIAVYSFFNTIPSYWIKWWTKDGNSTSIFYIVGYIIIALLAWSSTSLGMWFCNMQISHRSGIALHQRLVATIFGAPLAYFVQTDVGVTLNKFSQDIDLVDKQLASALQSFIVQVLKMLVQVGLLAKVQTLLLIVLLPTAVVVYVIQKIYLRTSRQLRVLELEAKSSLYSEFLETVEGVVSIRAFGWQAMSELRAASAINRTFRPNYLLLCLQRWLNLVLELVVSTIAIGLIAVAVLGDSSTGANIGVALNVILVANTTLVRLVTSWASLEISLGAIARLKNVEEHTIQEAQPWEIENPDMAWPKRGELRLKSFTTGYSVGQPVIENANITVQPGQKLVICGRTGSGKSTMFLALLRLVESTGTISIDGVDIAQMSRSAIRQRCFIAVPQEVITLPCASLRFNLDADLEVDQAAIVAALKAVGLWDVLSSEDTVNDTDKTLDRPLSTFTDLSTGQSQLFAMARAIVRKHRIEPKAPFSDEADNMRVRSRPILLLDEATSSLDSVTESKLYDIIEEEFVQEGYTVLIVSHRLGALVQRLRPGRDAVAILRGGRLTVENDLRKLQENELNLG